MYAERKNLKLINLSVPNEPEIQLTVLMYLDMIICLCQVELHCPVALLDQVWNFEHRCHLELDLLDESVEGLKL